MDDFISTRLTEPSAIFLYSIIGLLLIISNRLLATIKRQLKGFFTETEDNYYRLKQNVKPKMSFDEKADDFLEFVEIEDRCVTEEGYDNMQNMPTERCLIKMVQMHNTL